MRRRHSRRAVASVEMALVLPLLIFVFAAGVDFARVFNPYLTVTNCARNGAMYGSKDPTHAADTAGIVAAALEDASELPTPPEVITSQGTDAEGHPYVRVTVIWTFETISRFPGIPSQLRIRRTVQMRVSPVTPNGS